jgi:hypothetical protein
MSAVALVQRLSQPDVDAPATGGLLVPRTNTLRPPRFFAPLRSRSANRWFQLDVASVVRSGRVGRHALFHCHAMIAVQVCGVGFRDLVSTPPPQSPFV